jgi:peptide/nickel transport system ATP-binding protein/oligopeptide transport system ATP-binding protein
MEAILKVENLKKSFSIRKGIFQKKIGEVNALCGVSFEVFEKETFGIVGESGSGKSTLGRIILRLEEPTEGKVVFLSKDFLSLKGRELKEARKNLQVVFQDPASSLDPKMKIGKSVEEPLIIHNIGGRKERKDLSCMLLEKVGLDKSFYDKYPFELSGGQRQRVGIARAIALKPKLIICDEAASALDLSVQAQILNLLKKLQDEENISYIFITHSLSVAEHISHRAAVMYLGKFVESGSAEDVFCRALHPYTIGLLASAPVIDPLFKKEKIVIKGEIPSNVNLPKGCSFHPRCPFKKEVCEVEEPQMREYDKNHFVSCHFAGKIGGS